MPTSLPATLRHVAIAAALGIPSITRAQDTTRTKRDTVVVVQTPAPAPALPFDFSGVLYANYQTGGNRTERRTSLQNRFDVERAYLTFRAGAGDHMSIRVTTDLYQQRDSTRDQYYRGWAIRAKYAYAQYDYIQAPGTALKAVARLGMLHTPVVDYEEGFWPRGIAQTAPELNGYFSSSDVGVATSISLPDHWGEIYGGVYNGSGYSSRETDRFKDFGGRLTLVPFNATHGVFRTFAISPWAYKGWKASDFLRGQGTLDPVTVGRQKDRFGVHVGIKDPRITLATQLGWRLEQFESADTLTARTPTVVRPTASLVSAYTLIKPLAFINSAPSWPVNLVFRFDRVKPDTDKDPYSQFVVGGIGFDLNKKASLWFDYQDQDPKSGSTAADLKTFFVHAIVNFP